MERSKTSDNMNESIASSKSSLGGRQKQNLVRKTYKHRSEEGLGLSEKTESSPLGDSMRISTSIEPSSQIEKSKKTVKHYEELIRKNSGSLLGATAETNFDDDKKASNADLSLRISDFSENENKLE